MMRSKEQSVRRILGIVLMGFALSMALDSDYPLAKGDFPRVEVPGDLLTKYPLTVSPQGTLDGDVEEFRWRWSGRPRSWQVVILDQSTEELFRSRPIVGDHWLPSARELLKIGRNHRLYWYVSSGTGTRRIQSDLRSFSLR